MGAWDGKTAMEHLMKQVMKREKCIKQILDALAAHNPMHPHAPMRVPVAWKRLHERPCPCIVHMHPPVPPPNSQQGAILTDGHRQ